MSDLTPNPPGTRQAGSTPPCLVVTCEHGGNRIPERYAYLFEGKEGLLASHRGWDPGALSVSRFLARAMAAPLFFSTTSRLLVDLNRSSGHPRVFSEITRSLPIRNRSEIMARWYRPYRRRVERSLWKTVRKGHTVVHIAVHSFTPILDGKAREVDIGLLYDPARGLEREFSRRMSEALRRESPQCTVPLRIRSNQPYRGTSDGLTTHLRRRFPPDRYAGIEIEVNQRMIAKAGAERDLIGRLLLKALQAALAPPSFAPLTSACRPTP